MRGFIRLAAAAAVAVAAAGPLAAQKPEPKVLLKPVDMGKVRLDAKQQRLHDALQGSEATVGAVKVVRLEEDALAGTAPVTVPLPDGRTVEMAGFTLSPGALGGRTLDWKGPAGTALLSVSERKSVNGLIYAGDRVYEVKGLGNGLQAVARIDQSKFKDHPPE